VFPPLFEGRQRPGADRLSSFSRVPVPFVFDPPTTAFTRFVAGDPICVDLTLVGSANARLPYIVHAMAEAGGRGLGPSRARLALAAVDRLASLDGTVAERVFEGGERCRAVMPGSPAPVSGGGSEFTVDLRTPLRLKLEGDLLTPDRFTPGHFANAVVRRISALAAFHGRAPIEADYRKIKEMALGLELVEREIRWAERRRYSSRQGQRMALGGFLGRFRFRVPQQAVDLVPWIDIGQWVGAGKAASMGLGQYRLGNSAIADA
jgi:hypothetical protein